ncbi:hypothetical protein GMA19_03348 [Paenibacillus polymyxa E681]|uniref:hypothetical protein n=1 Tax=Paenibacillus polymyxa TaxID=1406 RepID=UPI0001E31873|nr:hypothetical protein [Paenibacillus polymyxa]ADM71153.1 hypothetical protein PPE_03335 [Paenibacillus polymyxa E681]QNV58175.1 hypothetical protein GE561_03348 [Paenibacillus polymyxa E681]QNV63012.1 hypothetical protein GMA19_03348 [Paenibacillus polymyxa E681]
MINQFSRSPKLRDILNVIETVPTQYSDEEIILYVDKFLPSYNCEGAAIGYFSIISHLCYYRPDLESQLIKIALKPLYYLGIEHPDSAIKWIKTYVKEKNDNDYYTSKQGRTWITNHLKDKHELITRIFKEIDFEDNAEDIR